MNADDTIRSLVDQFPALDNNGRLVGPEPAKAEEIHSKLLAGGEKGFGELVALLGDESLGYKPQYAVHSLATRVCRGGAEKERGHYAKALAAALAGDLSTENKKFVIRQLQLIGLSESVGPLGDALADKELAFDAATAMGNLGSASAAPLRAAFPKTEGRTRAAVLQALGRIGDAESLDLMKQGTGDADADVRLVAVWSLARLGKPAGIASIFAAINREQVARAPAADACLCLAERLTSGGNQRDAREVYQQVRDTFTQPQEKHIREAAERALKA